jgi:DNA-directed RNA polymerase specialized sigma24 family protein
MPNLGRDAVSRVVYTSRTMRSPAFDESGPHAVRRRNPAVVGVEPRGVPSSERGIHSEDVELVQEILSGSEGAWREFIERYAGLIWAVSRRYVYSGDPDAIRTLFANTLDSLYRRKLATYQGRSALSTWITLVTRTEVLDFLRHQHGRKQIPRALKRMSPLDRKIFQLFYVEGTGLSETIRQIAAVDPSANRWSVLAALRRIENVLDSRTLRRIAYDLHAQSTGAASGRMLAYLDHVRDEFRATEAAHRPEYYLMEREARRVAERVRELIAELPASEREILTLRFERGWSARRIAEELGLPEPRGAYTLIERILRALRRRIEGADDRTGLEEG